MNTDSNQLFFGPFVLDRDLHLLFREGARIDLEPKVFDTLKYLVEHPGRLLTKAELMKAIWPETFVEEGNLQRNVSLLRDALGEFGEEYIETRRKEGYIFWPEATDASRISNQECPWVGLRVLREADSQYLFGRDVEVRELIYKLDNFNFLAVVGSSGTGKSSLVRAGVVPALRHSQNAGTSPWVIGVFTPGYFPLQQLANQVLALTESDYAEATRDRLVEYLRLSPEALLTTLEANLLSSSTTTRILLIVDQFEELVTLCDNVEERELFIANLLGAVSRTREHVSIVLTVRTDFYSKLEDYPILWRHITENQYGVKPLSRDALRQTIEGPAKLVDLQIEEGLVDEILDDLGDERGALPLLSHTMTELFNRRQNNELTLKSYRIVGGVRGAIANHAEGVFARFSPAEKRYAQHIMISLTKVRDKPEHDVRQRKLLSELVEDIDEYVEVETVVRKLSDERLLTTTPTKEITVFDDKAPDVLVEVCHEALIQHWPRLRRWLNDNREALLVFEKLDAAAREWEESNEDPELLYHTGRLQDADSAFRRYAEFVRELHLRFLTASRELVAKEQRAETQRRNLKNLAKIIGLVLLLLVFLLAGTLFKWREATAQRDLANSLRTAADSVSQLSADPEQSLLLAIEAGRLASTKQADAALRRALAVSYQRKVYVGHYLQVISVAVSPNGRYLLTGGADNEARLWDVETGETIRIFRGHQDWVNWAAFSPDGKRVVTASRDATVRIWNAETGETLKELRGHVGSVQNVVFSPDGARVLTAGEDGTARVWDAQTGVIVFNLKGHLKWVNTAVFSPDGKLIATASGDGTARIWDAHTGGLITTLFGHKGTVLSVAFAADGKKLVTASSDKTAQVWNVGTWERGIELSGHKGPVNSAEFSLDGKWMLTGSKDGTARVWNAQTGTEVVELYGHRSGINAAVFSRDAQFVFTASGDSTVRMWEPWLYRRVASLRGHSDAVTSAVYSPDGKFIVTTSHDRTARIWNANDWKQTLELRHPDSIEGAAFSPDAMLVATSCADGKARLWDSRTGELKKELTGHKELVHSVAFSEDGKRIVTGSKDGTAKIWDVGTGLVLETLEGHKNEVSDAVFSPDGKWVATASHDNIVRVWDTQTAQTVFQLNIGTGQINSVSFSRNGEYLIAACQDQTTRVWSVSDRQSVAVLRGHEQSVSYANFSPNGSLVLTAGADGTARLWELGANELLSVFASHEAPLTQASFSPDGRLIAVADASGVVEVYSCNICGASTQELLQLAQSRKTRELTPAERQRFLTLSNR